MSESFPINIFGPEDRRQQWLDEGRAAARKLTKAERAQVVQLFSCYYHSGFGTRGYHLQCTCRKWLRRRGVPLLHSIVLDGSPGQDRFYLYLILRYGRKI